MSQKKPSGWAGERIPSVSYGIALREITRREVVVTRVAGKIKAELTIESGAEI